MKYFKLIMPLFVLVVLGIISCTDDNKITYQSKEYSSRTVKEMINVQNQFDLSETLFDQVKDELEKGGLQYRNFDCVDISTSSPFGQFPNTITLDFGNGCEINDSVTISGKILITMSGFLNHTGDSIITEYQQFTVNGTQINGIKIVKNLGNDNEGFRNISKKILNASVLYDNGKSSSFSSNMLFRYSTNSTIFNPDDDIFKIRGNCSGEDKEGNTYICIIKNELYLPVDCACIVSGEQEVTINNEDVYNLNYGDGTCDDTALLTYPDSTTEDIKICDK